MELIVCFIMLMVVLVLGVPIPFGFGLAAIWLTYSLGYEPSFLMPTAFSKLSGVVLLAIPLFIMAGGIMEKGRLGSSLIDFVGLFVGRVKGSLAIIAVITSAVFGSICGSGAATLSCIGSIVEGRMKDLKYPTGISAAVVCCAAPLGLLIPPSGIQILYAWVGQLSVLACFLATVVPGIILTILLSITSWFMLRNNPDIIIAPKEERSVWIKNCTRSTKSAVPALLMPVLILGGIYGGFMTPTEAAAISVFYAVPVSMFIYKGMKFGDLKNSLIETATTTGVVMIMIALIMILSRIFIMESVPDKIITMLMSISENPVVIMIMINVFMVIIGMLMDDVSGTLLCTPILLPLVVHLGISPYHFAAILGVNLGMGNITPPSAPFLYLGARIFKVNVREMLKPCLILIIFAYIPTLILVTYVPEIALWLPKLVLGSKLGL